MKKFILGLMMLTCSLLHAKEHQTIDVKLTENRFTIILPANPTTGYQWSIVNYDKNLFMYVTSNYLPPESKLMGASGTMKYSFELRPGVKVPPLSTMLFNYARPWEKEPSLKVITLHFQNETP